MPNLSSLFRTHVTVLLCDLVPIDNVSKVVIPIVDTLKENILRMLSKMHCQHCNSLLALELGLGLFCISFRLSLKLQLIK